MERTDPDADAEWKTAGCEFRSTRSGPGMFPGKLNVETKY